MFMKEDLPRLQYLLARYCDDTCTPAERQELMVLIKENQREADIKQFFEQEMGKGLPAVVPADMQLSPDKAEILFKEIVGVQQKKTARVTRMWRHAAAAAILIGVIGTVAYLGVKRSPEKTPPSTVKRSIPPAENDVLPGTKGAILTLSNGQQIILDSAANGKLTSQGSTVIINRNGQIVYDEKGAVSHEMLINTMTTPRGRQYQLVLSDGTKVWLNSASSIRYPAAFSGSIRTVTITGEAYLEVAKNKQVPFVVKVDNMEVKVLGTHFNINAYPDEESIKTTLLEGSVQVNIPGDTKMLAPGQQSQLYKTGPLQLVKNANLDEAIAWKEGVFSFNNSDIQSVMRQIGRWFDLTIEFEGEIPKDRFGGKLPMNAKVSEVLGALEQTQVHFRIEGKKLVVMP